MPGDNYKPPQPSREYAGTPFVEDGDGFDLRKAGETLKPYSAIEAQNAVEALYPTPEIEHIPTPVEEAAMQLANLKYAREEALAA